MIDGVTGSSAMAPVVSEHCESVSGVQLAPCVRLFHTPPDAAPMISGPPTGDGAIADTRPASSCGPDPKKPPPASNRPKGPIGRHDPTRSGADENAARGVSEFSNAAARARIIA